MAQFDTGGYSMVEIFAKSDHEKNGLIQLKKKNGVEQTELAGRNYYRFLKLSVEPNATYELICHNCHISFCYLSGHPDILDVGVCFLENGTLLGKDALGAFYDTPYREQYHFSPFKNWNNDPNGLCWFQGRYHLFYQANPNAQKWDDMYWGHAASKDLVHWVHLPIVLTPQQELLGNPQRRGGAFSGCAVPLEDEVLFYLTRHDAPQGDGPGTIEWQTMTRSRDMLSFAPEEEILRRKPKGAGYDYRDPKVLNLGDWWYLVLGSSINGISAILLYRSADMEHWEYRGPLVEEPDPGASTIECPDFFLLDGVYVAVGALMKHTDEYGRFQMTRCYIGEFRDERLNVLHTQWYDFGSNLYAAQSFEHEGRRLALGWISDFYNEHRERPSGAYGSMSLPRELHMRNGRLYMKPAAEVYGLVGEQLYSGSGPVSLPEIKGNSYYAKALFDGETDFSFLLGKDGESSIWLKREGGTVFLKTVGTNSSHVDFPADVTDVRTVEIFVDRRTVEVFLNDGEAAGTKIFYSEKSSGVFRSEVAHEDELRQIELYAMESIW